VGKTTLAALLAMIYAQEGRPVLAIDADPAACLADALGLPAELAARLKPISEMDELIFERTGARPGTSGGFFSINPRVDDLPDRFSVTHRGVKLLQMGTIELGGSGCICPESAMLKALVTHVILYRDDVLILDMEAGLEHLGRATASAVDAFIAVVEPGRRSLNTARQIAALAAHIGVKTTHIVGNKVRNDEERAFIAQEAEGGSTEPSSRAQAEGIAEGLPVLGYLPYSLEAIGADMRGQAIYDAAPDLVSAAREIAQEIKVLVANAELL
jgi:CO dehydrogenase maturation factor